MSRVLGTALSSSQPVSCNAAPGLNALKPLHRWQGAQIPQAPVSPVSFSSTRGHRCPLFGHLWTVTPPRHGLAPAAGQHTVSPGTTSRRLLTFFLCTIMRRLLLEWKKKKKSGFLPIFHS